MQKNIWSFALIAVLILALGGALGFSFGIRQVPPPLPVEITQENTALFEQLFIDNAAVTTWVLLGSGEVVAVDTSTRFVTIQKDKDQLVLFVGEQIDISGVTDPNASAPGVPLNLSDLRPGDTITYTGTPTSQAGEGYDVAVQSLYRLP